MIKYLLASFLLLGLSCSNEPEQIVIEKLKVPTIEICQLDSVMQKAGLVNVQTMDSAIYVSLKYSTTNNFLNTNIYSCLKQAYVQAEVADMLEKAQANLSSEHPDLHLLVLDATRPLSSQQLMWDTLNMPFAQKVKYVSNPRSHSVHNYGSAVDVTLCDSNLYLLDMGTDYDHFGTEATINAEWNLILQGKLNSNQLDNRKLLRKVMREAGFKTIWSEWWHFNAFSRRESKKRFDIIK